MCRLSDPLCDNQTVTGLFIGIATPTCRRSPTPLQTYMTGTIDYRKRQDLYEIRNSLIQQRLDLYNIDEDRPPFLRIGSSIYTGTFSRFVNKTVSSVFHRSHTKDILEWVDEQMTLYSR